MSLVIAIAAVIVSALTMIIVALQVAEAREANALPATIDLFREYRSAEMEKARWLLTERLPDLDPASGMRGLPDDVAVAAFQSASTWTTSVSGSHAGSSPLSWPPGSWETAACGCGVWRVLSPFIVRERELRTPPHYQHSGSPFSRSRLRPWLRSVAGCTTRAR